MADKSSSGVSYQAKEYVNIHAPDFKGRKVFILDGAFYTAAVRMFAAVGCEKAESVKDADFVVFLGGVDVNPAMYGEEVTEHVYSWCDSRDAFEKKIYEQCRELNKPMFGICRGAQFLHVMNGGKLWQHVENHAGSSHVIYDIEEHCLVEANSYHHQAIALDYASEQKVELIAVCNEQVSKKFYSKDLFIDLTKERSNINAEIEVEAAAYPETQCLVVQGHPEVGTDEYASWSLNKLYDYLVEWEDLQLCKDLDDDELPANMKETG